MRARAPRVQLWVPIVLGAASALLITLPSWETRGDPCIPSLVGQLCGYDIGLCEAGVYACDGGNLYCVGGKPPTQEICNGVDDDCDGLVDEDFVDAGTDGAPCVGPGVPSDRMHGPCLGNEVCHGDAGLSCITCEAGVCGPVPGPTPETCNGLDEDCDGVVDNPNPDGMPPLCPDGGTCISGSGIKAQCAVPCHSADAGADAAAECPSGLTCVTIGADAGFCITTGALGAPCNADDLCQPAPDAGAGAKGHCADGVCCDAPCGGCKACTAKLKGPDAGADGICAPLKVRPPDGRCMPCTSSFECPEGSVCNAAGACAPPVVAEPTPGCFVGPPEGAGALSVLALAAALAARARRRGRGAQRGVKTRATFSGSKSRKAP